MRRDRIRRWTLAITTLVVSLVAGAAVAQTATKQYVFPAKDQTPEQQAKDEKACADWAKKETSFDPANPPAPPQTAPPPQQAKGSTGRSAVRGAATGYIIGDLANDEGGEGAAIGAVVGAASSNRRNKAAQQNAQQQQQAANQQYQQTLAKLQGEYDKARAACLEAKGYTVK